MNVTKRAHRDRRGYTVTATCGCKLVNRGRTNRHIFCADEGCGSVQRNIPPASRVLWPRGRAREGDEHE